MKRRRRPTGSMLDHFDEVYEYLPQMPEVRKIVSTPRKLIIINTAAAQTGRIIRIGPDGERSEE